MERASALVALALIGCGVWLRSTSLGSLPEPLGDEAFYGLQAWDLDAGRPFAVRTPNGTLMSPFTVPVQALLLKLARPSLPLLRLPALASNLLALGLMYALGRRSLDRTTAVIATVLFAVLPMAIVTARIGCDFSHSPLAGVVALHFAFRGHGPGLVAAVACGLLAHPTNLFLVPVVGAVYLVGVVRRPGGWAALRRWLPGVALAAAGLAAFGVATLRGSASRYYAIFVSMVEGRDRGWGAFLASVGRFFSGVALYENPYNAIPPPLPPGVAGGFIGGFAALVALALLGGLPPLIRGRRWDRLAPVAGLVAALVAFRVLFVIPVLAGPQHRYGTFLIVPGVVALACLLRAGLIEPTDRRRAAARRLQELAIAAACVASLLGTRRFFFDRAAATGSESIWTLRDDRPDPFLRALRLIARVHARSGGGRCLILAQDWRSHKPLEFLARPRPRVNLACYEGLGAEPGMGPDRVRETLRAGGFVVGQPDSAFARLVEAQFPPGALTRWIVSSSAAPRFLAVYRLASPAQAASDRGGPAKPADAASAGSIADRTM